MGTGSVVNKYGLSRDIPEPIKRIIRQACGFGCVICGSSIVEYEHVDPEFSEARQHTADNITLLCPKCHSMVTRRLWSKEKVRKAMANPRSRQTGFSSELFDVGTRHPSVAFAGVTLTNCPIPILIRDLPLFKVEQAETGSAPFRLSANFFTSSGNPSLFIRDNEWIALASNWDVEVSGVTITIRDAPRRISLRLVADPPAGIIIHTLDMYVYGYRFLGNRRELVVETPRGSRRVLTGLLIDGCDVGMKLE